MTTKAACMANTPFRDDRRHELFGFLLARRADGAVRRERANKGGTKAGNGGRSSGGLIRTCRRYERAGRGRAQNALP
jgi:hypothetical protein